MDLDLTALTDSRLAAAVYEALKDLPPGEEARVHCSDNPELALKSVNLQLRDGLRWQLETQDAVWTVRVRRTEDVAPRDVPDALLRDHRRLDKLFAQAIHLTDAGRLDAAEASLAAFVAGIDKHFRVENDVLAAAIPAPPRAAGANPVAEMVREHGEILDQARMIAAGFAEEERDADTLGALLAILAGYLAKHEQREEAQVFPLWQGALARASERDREALLKRVLEILA